MEVKDIIKSRRIELGLTMKELADAVGVSESAISRWESGDIANMRRDRIYTLANKLGLSPLVIMGYEEQDNLKAFTDIISTMSEAERDDVMKYINFIVSQRK